MKEIIEFIQSDDRLRDERLKAKKNRDKYVGIDSDNIQTSSSSHSGGFSDYSRSGFSSTGGFGSEGGGRKAYIPDLDDKKWRSSNPTITERISDITSRVKELMDVPPNNDHNLDISDNEEDLGIGIGKFEDKKSESSPKNKIKLDLKPSSNLVAMNSKKNTPVIKVQEKKQPELAQPDLLGLDNDDFDDFVSHRIVPEASNNNNIQQKNTSSIDFFSNDVPSSTNTYSPLPSSNQSKSNNNNINKISASVDLFDIGIPEEASSSGSIDLFSLSSQTATAKPSDIVPSVASKNTNSLSDFDFFDFGSPAPTLVISNVKPMMPSSATLPNLNLLVVI